MIAPFDDGCFKKLKKVQYREKLDAKLHMIWAFLYLYG